MRLPGSSGDALAGPIGRWLAHWPGVRINNKVGGESPSVAYVVFNEQLWHPLLKGQVVELLSRLRPQLDVEALYLLAFVPARDLVAHCGELDAVRVELERVGVILELRSLPALRRPRPPFNPVWGIWTPHESRRTLPLAKCLVGKAIVSFKLQRGVALFHARSYPAAAAIAPAVRLIGGKLIFDTRSPFPEENLAAGRWADDAPDFAYWKRAERHLLRSAAATVAIAPTHEVQLLQTEPAARVVVIPNNVEVDRFAVAAASRWEIRRVLDFGPDEIVLCYLGSLNDTWNKPDIYARFFSSLVGWSRPHRLLLIVPKGDHPLVRSTLARSDLQEGRDYLLRSATPLEVPHLLAGADIGLQLFDLPDVRVGVKVVEYLAAGLPIVTNGNVQGAAALVEQEGVGIVLREPHDGLIGRLEEIVADRALLRERCLALAKSRFSTECVASQYAVLYNELLVGASSK